MLRFMSFEGEVGVLLIRAMVGLADLVKGWV